MSSSKVIRFVDLPLGKVEEPWQPQLKEVHIALVKACHGSVRGFRMLCDYLTVAGFLTKQGNRYRLTPDSQHFLTRSSPAYLGPTLDFLLSQPLVEGMRQLAGAVRKGGTMVGEGTVAPNIRNG